MYENEQKIHCLGNLVEIKAFEEAWKAEIKIVS